MELLSDLVPFQMLNHSSIHNHLIMCGNHCGKLSLSRVGKLPLDQSKELYCISMKTPIKNLSSVNECIAYVESLGYKLLWRRAGSYAFECIDKSARPKHNWFMSWTLGEMRHAIKNGC